MEGFKLEKFKDRKLHFFLKNIFMKLLHNYILFLTLHICHLNEFQNK